MLPSSTLVDDRDRGSFETGDRLPSTVKSQSQSEQIPLSPIEGDSYFNSFRSSRAPSVYSLSRISLSSQLSQLTALALPNSAALSASISTIATAPAASTTLGNAAEQILKWLQKAAEVLNGLDAEDDVEWAAAGGREGLGEVDASVGKFEELIRAYVTAIENLQARDDVSDVPAGELKAVVNQMEKVLTVWEEVRQALKDVKAQVELAMEWEELWNVVLGDIGLEVENLSRLVFEMEEARHKALFSTSLMDNTGTFDVQELDTIIEEGGKEFNNQQANASPDAQTDPNSPMSPGLGIAPDDARLMALFARLQPLRASLNFLPMTLSSFRTRAEAILPTACQELESRRKSLLKKYETLEGDAEGLREELGEDRWVVLFRNAGRQVLKLCESVERTVTKLQEFIDAGTQHSNPPLLAKKVGDYETKKSHVVPSIEKLLSVIGKGVASRLTVNGEILRLHLNIRERWQSMKTDLKDMDLALDDLTKNRNQQLRDSISSIMTMDRSSTQAGSPGATPGSSPTSPQQSVMIGPPNGAKRDASPSIHDSSRRSSLGYISTTRPSTSRRNITMPAGTPASTQLPRKLPISRSFNSDAGSRGASPSPYTKHSATTPTPGGRPQRPSIQSDSKPRWNSSPKVDHFEFGSKPRSLPYSTPPLDRRSSIAFRSPTSIGSHPPSGLPLSSPLGRSSPMPSPASTSGNPCPRDLNPRTSTGNRKSLLSANANSTDWVKLKETSPSGVAVSKRQSLGLDASSYTPVEESPSARPRLQRPNTSMSGSRRISMLPLPKTASSPLANDSRTAPGARVVSDGHGRQTSLGSRPMSKGRDSSMGVRRPTS